MPCSLRPAALTEGKLAADPFLHLVLASYEYRFNGSLVLWSGDQPFATNAAQQRMLFEEGVLVAGDIESEDRNLFCALLPLTVRRGGGFRFLPGVDVVGDARHVLRGHVDPYTLVASALRGPVRADVVDATMLSSGGRILQVRTGVTLERLGLTPEEWNFVQELRRRPASAPALMVRSEAPEYFVKRMIYLLRVSDMAIALPAGRQAESQAVSVPGPPPVAHDERVGVTSERPSGVPEPLISQRAARRSPSIDPLASDPPFSDAELLPFPPIANDTRPLLRRIPSQPPAEMGEGLAYRYRQIVRHHERMRTRNLFEILGVGPEESDEAIGDACAVLMAQWRVDSLPSALGVLIPLVEDILAGLQEAHDILTTPQQRYEYIERLRHGDGRLLSLAVRDDEDHRFATQQARRREYVG